VSWFEKRDGTRVFLEVIRHEFGDLIKRRGIFDLWRNFSGSYQVDSCRITSKTTTKASSLVSSFLDFPKGHHYPVLIKKEIKAHQH
jgi:hypothetical protein